MLKSKCELVEPELLELEDGHYDCLPLSIRIVVARACTSSAGGMENMKEYLQTNKTEMLLVARKTSEYRLRLCP